MMSNNSDYLEENPHFSIFVLGFRPFFLASGIFSVVSMTVWTLMYVFGLQTSLGHLPNLYWHAHEMLYGFAMAVVTGFLLTAVKNWTGKQTLQYKPLLILFLMWLGARLCMLLGAGFFIPAAVLDLSFNIFLFIAVAIPVIKAKQSRQIGIVSKVFLLALFNSFFYLGLFGFIGQGLYWGIYGGLFLLLGLVLTMGRRVMPFFIEKGVGYPVQLKNSAFLDNANLLIFLAFSINEVFFLDAVISSYLAIPLFLISCIRLFNWHTKGIWSTPLLWGLYASFIVITLGFLLFALLPYVNVITRSISLHAFTLGGFGLLTLSMMSRVTIGHTGRSVKQPSVWVRVAQWLLLMGCVSRVLLPLFLNEFYIETVFLSQCFWITGFAVFVLVNYPLLTKARIDGAAG
jgi:uncharacterized protein involved in response to NO